MANGLGSKTGETIEATMQDLLVATVRLSTALTLYGLEQLQNVAYARTGRPGLSAAVEKLGTGLDSVTDSLVLGMDETKKDALISVSTAARYVIRKSLEIVSPVTVLEAANDLLKKASEPIFALAGKKETVQDIVPDDGPQLAVDVLTGPPTYGPPPMSSRSSPVDDSTKQFS